MTAWFEDERYWKQFSWKQDRAKRRRLYEEARKLRLINYLLKLIKRED
jgi:hypothetical protein